MKNTVTVREDMIIVGTEQDGWKFTADDIFALRDGKEMGGEHDVRRNEN